jgi:hypothetical protein
MDIVIHILQNRNQADFVRIAPCIGNLREDILK